MIFVQFSGSPRGSLWFSVYSVAGFCRVLLGSSVFNVSQGGNAVEFEHFGFLLSLYMSRVLPGASLWFSVHAVAGFCMVFMGALRFSMHQTEEMLSNLKIMVSDLFVHVWSSPGGSLLLSVHCVVGFCKVLLGVFIFQCITRGHAVESEN